MAAERWRRRRLATVLLVLLGGLSAAVPMAMLSAGRRTADAVDHFIATADVADTALYVCPPGASFADDDPMACFLHDPVDELAAVQALPGVERASRFGFSPAAGGAERDPATWEQLGVATLADPVPDTTPLGEPIVVDGRAPNAEASDELAITEAAAAALGIGAGDDLWLTSLEVERDPVVSTVVGVIRTPADLLPLDLASVSSPPVFARQGWVEAHGEDFPAYGGLAVWLDEDTEVDDLLAAARERLPDQVIEPDSTLQGDERETIDQAIRFEARAALVTGGLAALIAVFLVGQAVARQARSEGDDDPVLAALGFTQRQLVTASFLRWLPVALAAAVVAAVGAVAASTLGPVGVARRGPWERTVHVDLPVLALGSTVVALLVVVTAVAVARRSAPPAAVTAGVGVALGPPGVRTGVGLALRSLSRRGALPLVSAVVATALAIALVITVAGGVTTLHVVLDEPERFGVAWDALIEAAPEDAGDRLAGLDGVEGAAWIAGTDVDIGRHEEVWLQAYAPVDEVEVTRPVIVEGQEPVTDTEIALGRRTSAVSGVSIGDEVEVHNPVSGESASYRVVGLTMVTDGFEPNVGHGAHVTPDGMARVVPEVTPADIGVALADGGRDDAVDTLAEAFPNVQSPFPVPSSLANAERVSTLPTQLAVGAGLLAAITLGHALIIAVRRQRRELAVHRVLGFTRRQVVVAVAVQATVLALAAVAIGVPLGVMGARWTWRLLAAAFGVATEPLVPVGVVLLAAVAAVVVANLAATPPGLWVAHVRPARALRTE